MAPMGTPQKPAERAREKRRRRVKEQKLKEKKLLATVKVEAAPSK
jgi:hypothetical protein